EWGARSGVAAPAIRAYGELWYSHVYRQVKAKKPFGHVFIPDKVDLLFRRRGVFANYTREETAASKNFYIARCSLVDSKLITAWLNSTIFLAMLVLLGRKISETWTRLLESDYLELPIPDLSRLRGEQASEILEQLSKVMQLKLPPMWAQLGEGSRRSLDIAVAKALRVKSPEDAVEELYRALAAALHARGCMGS
ncbi:MAG: restriction endonuclease subunit M, partial [Thermoproteota archaeon]